MVWFAAIVIWVICGFLAYGLIFGHFQRMFPDSAKRYERDDRWGAFMTAILGPMGLAAAIIFARHGFMWRSPK